MKTSLSYLPKEKRDELKNIVKALLQFKEVEKHHFNLLQRAYIDSRYKKGYTISKKELEYLSKQVSKLRDLTEKVCEVKIESF